MPFPLLCRKNRKIAHFFERIRGRECPIDRQVRCIKCAHADLLAFTADFYARQREVILAIKWRFGKQKEDDAVEGKPETAEESLNGATESTNPETASETELPAEPSGEVTTEAPLEETADQVEPATEETSSEPLSTSMEVPAEQPAETEEPSVEQLPVEPAAENEEIASPAEETAEPVATEEASPEDASPASAAENDAAESAETEPSAPEEGSAEPSIDEIAEAIVADDDWGGPVVPQEPAPEAPAEEAPAEQAEGEEPAFVMDEEYLRAFQEEGELDDYVYGEDFASRQELLEKIKDNAETLAEEGTELLEQKEKEKEEKKNKEPVYNEKGELLDDDGKAILKRSLENKLILADTRERRYYNKLKNELLAYEGVKAEMQTATEVFRRGKETVARVTLAGFTRIYFALNPEEFDVERYKQADKTAVDFEDAKMLIRVRNDDEFAIATELIAIMMGALGINRLENPPSEDYLPAFPRREDAVLDKKGKMLAFEEKDEQALIREKRAEERKAAGLSEEPEPEVVEEEVKEEPLVILPLTLDNKLHQSTNTIKLLYSKLKNEILSYKGTRAEMTVKNENFKLQKRIIARMTVVGECVRLYLALDPADYSTKKYKHKDAFDQPGYEGTLLMMKIASEKDRLLAVKLIDELVKKYSLERNKRYAYVPYAEKYPYIKNGVFKGEEDLPRVPHEGDEYVDIYGELTEHLRSQMGLKDAWGVPKGYTAEDGLTARDLLELQRSKAKTLNAGVALASPIVYFYDAAINEEGEVQYLNVQQVLNDKFLGKMIPQVYFAMAESSTRIEELNFFAIDEIVKNCNENPDVRFVTKISCRLLLKQETLTKLVDRMKTEHGNLILAFDCAMLEAVGFIGISAINTLKSQGALIMIDNAESASMRVLTEYDFDYLRLDARYYDGDSEKRLAHLDMITGYADVQNIVTTSINCEHKENARILLDHGVKVIQGDAVARPMRLINLALTNIKPVPKVKKDGENR